MRRSLVAKLRVARKLLIRIAPSESARALCSGGAKLVGVGARTGLAEHLVFAVATLFERHHRFSRMCARTRFVQGGRWREAAPRNHELRRVVAA